ncbi:hypothetical protein ACJX0J_025371, partial [Zea mays]
MRTRLQPRSALSRFAQIDGVCAALSMEGSPRYTLIPCSSLSPVLALYMEGEAGAQIDRILAPCSPDADGIVASIRALHGSVRPLVPGAKLHAVVDACHNDSVLDLPFLCNMSRTGNWQWEDHRPPSSVCKGTSGGQAVLISGYSDDKSKFSMRHASEEQFSRFLLYEVDAIRKACASLEEGYLPPVTFIVVQKRHHTRFCPEDHCSHKQTDRRGNILPGTAVDTKICHPSESDFYLCSHSSIHEHSFSNCTPKYDSLYILVVIRSVGLTSRYNRINAWTKEAHDKPDSVELMKGMVSAT